MLENAVTSSNTIYIKRNFLDDTNPFMFSRSLFYVDFIRLIAGGAYLSTMNFIIVERFHATIELSTYEKKINYRLIVNAIFWQYLAGFWFTIMLYKGKI